MPSRKTAALPNKRRRRFRKTSTGSRRTEPHFDQPSTSEAAEKTPSRNDDSKRSGGGSGRRFLWAEHGREILRYIEGTPALHPLEEWARTDEALGALAHMLRTIHDATLDFVAPPDARWQSLFRPEGAEGLVICHTDLSPPNVIFQCGLPAALIDWDYACPATRLTDIATTATFWIPMVHPDNASMGGWPERDLKIENLRRRAKLLCTSYGLSDEEQAGVIDACITKKQTGLETHRRMAAAGHPAFTRMWTSGSGAAIQEDIDWLDQNRAALQSALHL